MTIKGFRILVSAIAVSLFASASAVAQPMPVDSLIIKGTLDNGMTYYIRHNANPKCYADFYIVHNVGAFQEAPNQDGLAHFLEHMAFNGTKHYPKKGIIDFLQAQGVRFGYNINAYTSKTETVYHMDNVPLKRESFVDSVLMVLHDWSGDISCEQKELDDERGVIREECRTRTSPQSRIFELQEAVLYEGSTFPKRNVIGSLDVINNFKREEILDFYDKWYRPNLQAIVVVGDFDAKEMESKIKSMFSDIKNPENCVPKETYKLAPFVHERFENMVDTSAKFLALKVFLKQPYPEVSQRAQRSFYKEQFIRQIISAAVSARMDEQVKSPDCPSSRGVMVSNASRTNLYFSLFTILPRGDASPLSLVDFYCDNANRLLRFGLTEDEFQSAKLKVVKNLRLHNALSPESVTDDQIVAGCVDNFLHGGALTYPSELQKIKMEIMSSLKLQDILDYIPKMFSESEVIYSYFYNPKDGHEIPSEQQIRERIHECAQKDLTFDAIKFKKVDFSIDLPKGKIIKSQPVKGSQTEVWTLSNGMRVWWTPADGVKSKTALSVNYVVKTGARAFAPDNIPAEKFAEKFMEKYLGIRGSDKVENMNSPQFEGIPYMVSFSASNAVITTAVAADKADRAFSVLNLLVTEPYFSDARTMKTTIDATVESMRKPRSSSSVFREGFNDVCYNNHPWYSRIDSAAVRALTPELLAEVHARQFRDAGATDVYICSSMPKEEIAAFAEKYLASMPAGYAYKLAKVQPKIPSYKGVNEFVRTFKASSKVSKATVSVNWLYSVKTDLRSLCAVDVLDYIMSARCLSQIREQRGGTYSVSFSSSIFREKKGLVQSSVDFETRPELRDTLVNDAYELLSDFCENGPTDEEMSAAKNYLMKYYTKLQKNRQISVVKRNASIQDHAASGVWDEDYIQALSEVTASDVLKTARKANKGARLLSVLNEE